MTEMTDTERAIVERFEAGEPAPESWRGDDGLREAVAEAIFDRHPMSRWGAENLADTLLSVVTAWAEQRARERAAEELRAAADGLARSGWTTPAADLRSRADALSRR